MSAAFKHSDGHQDQSNRPTYFTAGTKPILCMKNGGRLEKWAPYWILKWQHDSKIFQQPIKRAKIHQDHLIQPTEFKYVTKTDFYMQISSHPEKMSAIVKFQLTNWESLIRNIN